MSELPKRLQKDTPAKETVPELGEFNTNEPATGESQPDKPEVQPEANDLPDTPIIDQDSSPPSSLRNDINIAVISPVEASVSAAPLQPNNPFHAPVFSDEEESEHDSEDEEPAGRLSLDVPDDNGVPALGSSTGSPVPSAAAGSTLPESELLSRLIVPRAPTFGHPLLGNRTRTNGPDIQIGQVDTQPRSIPRGHTAGPDTRIIPRMNPTVAPGPNTEASRHTNPIVAQGPTTESSSATFSSSPATIRRIPLAGPTKLNINNLQPLQESEARPGPLGNIPRPGKFTEHLEDDHGPSVLGVNTMQSNTGHQVAGGSSSMGVRQSTQIQFDTSEYAAIRPGQSARLGLRGLHNRPPTPYYFPRSRISDLELDREGQGVLQGNRDGIHTDPEQIEAQPQGSQAQVASGTPAQGPQRRRDRVRTWIREKRNDLMKCFRPEGL
ncbi:hypothetical protein EDC01DRAFT_630639 [Geopyxis carbonaria]|nr:hypothetical protein EDC01DRAFT_630639 [Geopyxis carbonaria]